MRQSHSCKSAQECNLSAKSFFFPFWLCSSVCVCLFPPSSFRNILVCTVLTTLHAHTLLCNAIASFLWSGDSSSLAYILSGFNLFFFSPWLVIDNERMKVFFVLRFQFRGRSPGGEIKTKPQHYFPSVFLYAVLSWAVVRVLVYCVERRRAYQS